MLWVGLTGGLASGKSTLSAQLQDLGIDVINADQISHQLTKKGQLGFDKIVSHFGTDILDEQGEIDRRKLGQLVFSNQEELKDLEGILHPLIQARVKKIREELQAQGKSLAIYDVPLLYEKNLQQQFDSVILVFCSEAEQKKRMKERNNWSEDEVQNRLAAQIPLEKKRQWANYIVDNNGSIEDLKVKAQNLLNEILPTKGNS